MAFLFLHALICLYGFVAGFLIYLGEKKQRDDYYSKTHNGQKPSLKSSLLHIQWFLFVQQRAFTLIVLLCLVMFVALAAFLSYHLELAKSNQTTNESYKRQQLNKALKHEIAVLRELVKECETTEEIILPCGTPRQLPAIRVDGELLPSTKTARLERFDEMYESWRSRSEGLNEKTPYKKKDSWVEVFRDLWAEK